MSLYPGCSSCAAILALVAACLVEHIWEYLRENAMRNTIFHSLDKVTNALIMGSRDLAADAAALTSITLFPHLRACL